MLLLELVMLAKKTMPHLRSFFLITTKGRKLRKDWLTIVHRNKWPLMWSRKIVNVRIEIIVRLSELRQEICAQTELSESELLLVQRTINAHNENKTVVDVFPTTSEEFPVVVSSASVARWRGVTRMKPVLRECSLLA